MFIVKATIIATATHPFKKNGETTIYYIGKDGYVYDRPESPTPWKRKHYASRYIDWDIRSSTDRNGDHIFIYEVVEV